ncbi:MAG: hypothetical protein A2W22_00210 [Candidatus Levybacteria bacterium RBG_16_35_11]|nr:MAG: hypothetical protein A2W22_00210 [Candidatus Levybacteria bacterium RBG_16_35_11]
MERLRNNPYPGRGIVMGFDAEGKTAIQIYWVMGRSKNSRNRKLVLKDGVVKTVPFRKRLVEDPSLIIYNAMRSINGAHIVTNGHQTDALFEGIKNEEHFPDVLSQWSEEPDKPNYTPRISGIVFPKKTSAWSGDTSSMVFSEIRRSRSGQTIHEYYPYNSGILPGFGKCIHTYEGDGKPLPSFRGNPYSVLLEGSIDQIAKTYWDLLDKNNRVALAVKTIDLESGDVDYRIINKLSILHPRAVLVFQFSRN